MTITLPLPAGVSLIRETPTFTMLKSIIVPIIFTHFIDGVDARKPHCFLGVQFFQNQAGTIPAFPTKGIVRTSFGSVANSPNVENTPIAGIVASAPTTLAWNAPTRRVSMTPVTITGGGVSHYRFVVTCNKT